MSSTRRDLLLGASGLSLGLGFAPLFQRLALASPSPSVPNLIIVFADGGWDTTYCLDPKLGEPEIEGPEVDEDPTDPDDREAVRTFGALPIMTNDARRPAVSTFFEQWNTRCSILNGISVGSIAHDPCRRRMLTGDATGATPDLTVMVGHHHGGALPLGAVDLAGFSLSGSFAASAGRVGSRSQLKTLVDPTAAFKPPSDASWRYPLLQATPDQLAALRAHQTQRADVVAAWAQDGGRNDRHLSGLKESLRRAQAFSLSAQEFASRLELGQAPSLGTSAALAVDLLSGGLCKSVLINSMQEWDTHTNTEEQHEHYEFLFTGLSYLADLLNGAGLLDNTMVAVLSEMTRTPKRNEAGGKDHWPHTSALFFGGPVRGGRVLGATDGLLESVAQDLQTGEVTPSGTVVQHDHLAAGIMEMFDIDPAEFLPGVQPFRGLSA